MARIAGIQIEKDAKGKPAYARINLKKHKEAIPILEQLGALEPEPVINQADYITSEELLESAYKYIDKLFEK